MDQSINLLAKIKQEFDCKEVDLRTYSPLTLAFLGDCVYDIIIRQGGAYHGRKEI